jgi:Periplasmic copper-binding protein (NosD)
MVVSQWRRWLNRISESSRRGGVGKRPRPAARTLLLLEVLEDRTSPAVFTVVNTLDDGSAGSLRWAINQANADADPVSNINFNIPGTGAHTIALTPALPTITHPLVIDGFTQPGSSPNTMTTSDNAVRLITLDGSNLPYIPDASQADGLAVTAGGSTIRGLVLTNFGVGVHLMTNGTDLITGNEINHCVNFGVEVEGSSNNTIGGITPDARNLITADFAGILIGTDQSGTIASANVVQGNYIGPDATGAAAASNNMEMGIWLTGNAVNNTIGGTNAAARNVISGATYGDVNIDYGGVDGAGPLGNVVEGNFIGTNAAGDAALVGASAPYGTGVIVGDGALTGNIIGGTTPGSGNTIAFNNGPGVVDAGGTDNPIEGNTIAFNKGAGVVVAGTGDRIVDNSIYGNGGLGIVLGGTYAPAPISNEPGGPFTGPNNSSITNLTATLSGSEVIVTGTLNGIADTPYFALFNINGDVSTSTTITTDASGTANFVADFAASEFPDFTGAVTFLAGGATPPHFGGNYLQNYPVLTAAQSGSSVLVSGTLNGQANTTFAVDVYASPTADPSGYGQGQYYLGYTTVTTDASGNASFAADFSAANLPGGVLPDGWAVSATATDPGGNTSEFSKDVFASSANALLPALTSGGTVAIVVANDAAAQAIFVAVNALPPDQTPSATLDLQLSGKVSQVTVNAPPNLTLYINGLLTPAGTTLDPDVPALVVNSGNVIVSHVTFTESGDAATILVTGGSLTLRNDVVQESTGYRDAAISITGGTVDLGTATDPGGNTLNINGIGAFIYNTTVNAISAVGDAFEINGQVTAWPAPLSVSTNSSLMLVGNSPPPLTGSVNGTAFTGAITYTTAYGDTVTVTLSTTATSASPVGQYAVIATLSGASAGNFVIDPATSTVGTMYVVSVGADPTSTTGAKSVVFWDNKGNAKLITTADLSSLDALNLVKQGGAAFDPKAVQQLQAWLSISPNATTAYQLAVDLAVMDLNVLAGNVQATDLIFAGALLPYAGADAISGLTSGGFIDVQSLMSAANAVLSQVNPGDPSGDPNQAYEAALAQVLQAADGNTDFVQQEVVWNLFGL